LGVLVILPSLKLPRESVGTLWIESYAGQQSDDSESLLDEAGFYAQPEILRQRLAALEPARPGVNVYFVGVAGDADEDVFRHELEVIRGLADERFATRGHSIVLVNNPQTVLTEPIATVTSLERTLKRVRDLMKPDDVLLLYLTSHGSSDHRFALELSPLHLRDLDPPALRKMLDAAGIRWRAIVISACYSGGFIASLREEHTLVITAADADHTSFGCGAESDFTYFGKAYFDEALRRTYSLTEAFDTARRSITAREKSEGLSASNPQIFVGDRMRDKLQQLEAMWASAGATLPAR